MRITRYVPAEHPQGVFLDASYGKQSKLNWAKNERVHAISDIYLGIN